MCRWLVSLLRFLSSGAQAYPVRCGNELSASGAWLQAQLKQLRELRAPKSP